MKEIRCPECDEMLEIGSTVREIECPFCGYVFENEDYLEDAVDETGPLYGEVCLQLLLPILAEEALASEDGLTVANPITDSELLSRLQQEYDLEGETEEAYLVWEEEEQGFVLASGGMHYRCDGKLQEKTDWSALTRRIVAYHEEEKILQLGGGWFSMEQTLGEKLCRVFARLNEQVPAAWERAQLAGLGIDLYCVEVLGRMVESVEYDPSLFGALAGSEAVYGSKLDRVGRSLGIPEEEIIYLFCDRSPIGTGKEGFALTDSGLYVKMGDKSDRIGWRELVDGEIVYTRPKLFGLGGGGKLEVCGVTLPTTSHAAERFLRALQEQVRAAEQAE